MSFAGGTGQTPDKLYYDITITNLQTKTTPPPIASFNESRNIPFVYKPEDYFFSIIRFTLDTPTLPILTPDIVPFSSNRNLTIYSFTLQWTNPVAPFQTFTEQTPIIFIPQDQQADLPNPPSLTSNGLQNNLGGYYNIYNYQYWIFLCNNTLTQCFNDLNTQVLAAGLSLPTVNAPVLTFDTQNNIGILNADQAGYDYTVSDHIKIYFNPALFQLFSSFPVIIENITSPSLGLNLLIDTNTFGGSNLVSYPPISPTYTAIQVFQEYSTIALWTPITSIVFTSSTLPIIPNQVSAPLLFFDGRIITNGNNSNISQIITDIVSDTGIYKPNIVYNPQAEYRLIELQGNRPLNNVDISIFYKNRVGELIPFRLSSGSTATVKILFTKKGSQTKDRNY
jgi:hypothetical protein